MSFPEVVSVFVLREGEEEGPSDGGAEQVGLDEEGVEERQEGVPDVEGLLRGRDHVRAERHWVLVDAFVGVVVPEKNHRLFVPFFLGCSSFFRKISQQ